MVEARALSLACCLQLFLTEELCKLFPWHCNSLELEPSTRVASTSYWGWCARYLPHLTIKTSSCLSSFIAFFMAFFLPFFLSCSLLSFHCPSVLVPFLLFFLSSFSSCLVSTFWCKWYACFDANIYVISYKYPCFSTGAILQLLCARSSRRHVWAPSDLCTNHEVTPAQAHMLQWFCLLCWPFGPSTRTRAQTQWHNLSG